MKFVVAFITFTIIVCLKFTKNINFCEEFLADSISLMIINFQLCIEREIQNLKHLSCNSVTKLLLSYIIIILELKKWNERKCLNWQTNSCLNDLTRNTFNLLSTPQCIFAKFTLIVLFGKQQVEKISFFKRAY